MKYSELIDKCVEIRRTWDPIIESLDAHADEFLKKVTDDNEKVFVKQVFFGTYRYEEFIKAFNNTLFKRSPAETNRNDAPLNGIFIYLVCFRLNELPLEEFKKLVLSQNPVKMHVLFQFLFNVDMLNQYVREEWCKLYDATYIDNVVIGDIAKNLPMVADLLATVSMKATGKVTDFVNSLGSQYSEKENKGKTWKPTEPKPFQITQPKVKALPQPIMIPKIVKSNPIPESTYKNNLKDIEEDKKKKREQTKEEIKKTYTDSKVQRFEFETEKRPTNLDVLKEEADKKFKTQTEMKTFFKPIPAFDKADTADIKMNAATILKEEFIIKRGNKEEEDYLRQVEMNMRDSSEFENWKKKMQDKDTLEKLELQEKRRIEMQLAREAAMKAVEHKYEKNKDNVEVMKQISKENKKEIEKKAQEEFEHKKELRELVAETKGNAEVEKHKVTEGKKKIHDQVKKEKKERYFMKLEEEEVERKKREELISKIRELEKRPRKQPKPFDPTETGGVGLLEELSLVQLRERLQQVRAEREEITEKKRVENIKKKEEKTGELKGKLAEIQALRKENAKIQAEKRAQKLKDIEDEKKIKAEMREKSLLEVHGKITKKKEDKQAELERIARELREIKLKRQYLNADKAILEAKAWQSLEEGAEREIKFRQNVKLLEQEGVESIKLRERKILATRATKEIEEKLDQLREYDRIVDDAKERNEVLYREEREAKKKQHEEIRNYERAHLDSMAARDPFKTKINTMNLTNAKTTLSNRSMKNTSVAIKEDIILPPSKYNDTAVIHEKPERLES